MLKAIRSILSLRAGRMFVALSTVALLVSVIGGLLWDSDGFPSNLLAEVAGAALSVLVALLVVEWLLDQHQRAQWEVAGRYIQAHFNNTLVALWQSLSSLLSAEPDLFFAISLGLITEDEWKELPGPMQERSRPATVERIVGALEPLSAEQWDGLPSSIRDQQQAFMRLIDNYARWLAPEQFEALWEVKAILESLERSITHAPLYGLQSKNSSSSRSDDGEVRGGFLPGFSIANEVRYSGDEIEEQSLEDYIDFLLENMAKNNQELIVKAKKVQSLWSKYIRDEKS